MKKIKIARIVTAPITYVHILNLLDSIHRSDIYELHFVCSRGDFLSHLKKSFPKARFHELEIARDINLVSDLQSLLKLFLLFKKEKFEIIHSNTPKAGLLSSIAGALSGIPIRLHTFTGQVWATSHGMRKLLLKFLDKFIIRFNTMSYADSHSQKDFLIEEGLSKESNLHVLHKGSLGGIDVGRFNKERLSHECSLEREKLFPNFKGKILIYLGRINKDKGILDLLQVFHELKSQFPVKLLIVGPLETKGDVNFNLLIEKAKSDYDIKFISFTSTPEVYLGFSDIFCFPSYREGFGTVALEAQALELPVVASNIYGLSDAVVNNETGLLFEARNQKDFRDKLVQLLSDESLAFSLGKEGRMRVERDFDQVILTKAMMSEYEILLKKYLRN